jgi:DNA-binding NarL/FixJ family response regulator
MLAEALQMVLEPTYEVVGRVADGRALLEAAASLKPDIIVLDIGMPLLNGLDAGRQLKQLSPHAKLIFLTFHEEPGFVLEAFRAGASGYLIKRAAAAELTHAIDIVLKGHTYISSLIAGDAVEALAQNSKAIESSAQLTGRQREVIQLLAEGRTMKEIAGILGVSLSTVADHKYHIMQLLQIKTNAELFQYAVRQGIVSL